MFSTFLPNIFDFSIRKHFSISSHSIPIWGFCIIFSVSLTFPVLTYGQTLAFPGAQGEARFATGGRGGQVIKVTNLNNSGTGSFRAAVEASGPRIVVFEVGGTIHLTNAVTINNGDLTIAGQTAPGDGIAIADKIVKFRAPNIITRYVRFRGDGNDDCIELIATNGVETNDLIFDHCSISWGGDENVGSIGTNGGLRQVTFQDCISSEGLMEHSMGMLITKNNATEFDVIRCLFAFSNARNPKFASGSSGNCVNNVMAGYGNAGLRIDQNAQVNVQGNIAVNSLDDKKVITLTTAGLGGQPTKVYVKDNIGPGRVTNTGDDWLAVSGPEADRVLTPAVPTNDIPVMDPNDALDYVLDNAGASLVRDAVDQRIIDQVRNNTGGLISVKPAPPVLAGGTPPVDSDNDGMSDDWENSHGLNANDASDQNLDRTGDGYTNIEEYINFFGPVSPPPANTPPTISSIVDQETDQDVTIGPINFTIGDAETSSSALTVTASSSNTSLVPSFGAMVLGGTGSNRNITITPTAGQDGTAVITLAVSDGTASTSTTFLLTVNDVPSANTPPIIVSNISDQFTDVDVPVVVNFTIDDAETPPSNLTVTALSNNTTVVPNANLVLGGSGADRNITITPASGEIGTSFITLTLSDGTDQDQGSFNVTVSDPGGNEPLSVTLSRRDVNCNGGADGRITSTVTGGTPPYIYRWSNGGSSPGNSNLVAGTYTLTVTDADDSSITLSEDVSEPTAIQLDATVLDATCNVSDGSVDLQVSGGTGPYTYSWSNGATTASLNNLDAGSYTVTVTDANDCIETATYNIGSGAVFTYSANVQDADCGNSNGAISLSVTGPGNHTYDWSNGATTADISGLDPGPYSVTITDANGCAKSASYDVGSIAGETTFQVTSIESHVTCNGNDGSIEITVSGGVSPYSYDWSHGATSNLTTGLIPGNYSVTITDANGCYMDWSTTLNTLPGPTKPTITQSGNTLTASDANSYQWYLNGSDISGATSQILQATTSGDYSVEIWDQDGCSAVSDIITVDVVGSGDPLALSLSTRNVSCVGENDGRINATVNGGTPPYSYSWSNGGTSPGNLDLSPGTYSLTVTDADGSSATESDEVMEPAAIETDAIVVDESCDQGNGSISLVISGGTEPYTYSWSNGATTSSVANLDAGDYSVTITDFNGCNVDYDVSINNAEGPEVPTISQSGITLLASQADSYQWFLDESEISGASDRRLTVTESGLYSVEVWDQNGCSAMSGKLDVMVVDNGDPLSLSLSPGNTSCNGGDGEVTSSVSGGAPPYSYVWSNGATSSAIFDLSAGDYSLTVTDANNNVISGNTEVLATDGIELEATIINASCNINNGSISVQASGGTGPYQYSWSNGSTSSAIDGLDAGDYTVTVTDENNCSKQLTYNVVSESELTFEVSIKNADCGSSNGSIYLSVSAAGDYTYDWSNGANTADITGLTPGIYSVDISDANGCEKSVSFVVGANAGEASFGIESTVSDATCNGEDGSIELSITGGVEPYTYLWSNGSKDNMATGLAPGNYDVTITDANGCYMDWSTSVHAATEPEIPTISQTGNILTATNADNHQWYRDGEKITGATEQSFEVTATGEYRVEIWGTDECVSISEPLMVESDDIGDGISRIRSLELYPNPVTSNLNIRMVLNKESQVGLKIFGIDGTPVTKRKFGSLENEMNTSLDLNGLKPGVYIVQIKASKEVVARRIIVM